jgi:hypothetical protein
MEAVIDGVKSLHWELRTSGEHGKVLVKAGDQKQGIAGVWRRFVCPRLFLETPSRILELAEMERVKNPRLRAPGVKMPTREQIRDAKHTETQKLISGWVSHS